ncbi:MAG: ATP synthase F0 subunit C [Eubacterium sp.]|nr:ATP synthase F0 subunit C [Eubacterium sp.]
MTDKEEAKTQQVSTSSVNEVNQDDAVVETEAVNEDKKSDSSTSGKAMAAALVVGLAAAAGAIGMGIAIAKSVEGISRQPEATGNIRTSLMLGLVFIETAIIYALIVAILIIFVM